MRMRSWMGVALLLLSACSNRGASNDGPPVTANVGLRYLRAPDEPGFEKANEPRPLTFPADHGSHPGFRTEWWYFTGNLESSSGDLYGFELTFFRVALRPPSVNVARASAWAADQIWMAHLAVTDVAKQTFVARERIARGALDLAGAGGE